ncbi:MAG TPA: chitobiase/beta-hexosaminidase C-terminal domain-containing protein [Opitutaceae bacterium]|nr:chitobiase/beta-hexosaminidase C-terminal domain-containing protein [Opitutaceae bacterium]
MNINQQLFPIARRPAFLLRALFATFGVLASALVASAQLKPAVAPPVFNPKSGEYGTALNVTIISTTAGASIRYTTDFTTPTETHGTLYSGPIHITATTAFRAIAFKAGFRDSQLRAASYVIGPNFDLSIDPQSRTLMAGQSTTFTVTVTPKFGFHGDVDLTFFDPPPGINGTFNPSTIVGGSGSSTFTIKTDIRASGTYSDFYVEGGSGNLFHAVAFALGVTPPPWAPGISYPAGVQVTYDGHTYYSLQANFSDAAHPPPTLPAVWNFNF